MGNEEDVEEKNAVDELYENLKAADVPEEEFHCPPCDAEPMFGRCPGGRIPKTLRSPIKPSAEAIELHYNNHLPYRNWCPICVKAKAREDAHRRGANVEDADDKDGLPTVGMDYNSLDENIYEVEEEKSKLKTIVVKDEATGEMFQHHVEVKGVGDEWLMKRLVKDFEELGRRDMILKSDGEPAMLAVQSKVQSMRSGRTVLKNPPAYNPESNGAIEKGVQDVTGHTRTLKLGLESRIKVSIPADAKIMHWIVEHAAFVLSKFNVGHDGMTPNERKTGQKWRRPQVEIGEVVFAKLVGKKRKKGKKDKQKKKLAEQSIEAIWVGQMSRTGEHIVVQPGGDALRCRTVRRVPLEDRWSSEKILAIEATPRRPTPSRSKSSGIDPKTADDQAGFVPRELRPRAPRQPGGEASGEQLAPPEARDPDLRDFRITDKILEKYGGYASGCPGCEHKAEGRPGHRGHSQQCRARLQEAMQNDDEGKALLDESRRRLESKHGGERQAERAPRAPERSIPPEDDAGEPDHPAEVPAESVATPRFGADSESDDDEDMDEIPELNEVSAHRSQQEAKRDREEEFDDSDNEPNAKRPKLKAMKCKPSDVITEDEHGRIIVKGLLEDPQGCVSKAVTGNPRPRPRGLQTTVAQTMASLPEPGKDPDAIFEKEAEELLENLNVLKSLRQHTDVKHILSEIDEGMRIRGMDKKPPPLRHEGKYDVAEIYSPPRITEVAKEIGLQPGWALDLTEVDPDDQKPWDFRLDEKKAKAKKKVIEEKPYVLILCPMCGPFSSLQNFNYVNKPESEVKAILKEAMEHIKFAIELCVIQQNSGRLFVFEHPAGASTWETKILKQLHSREGVFKVNFDFCMAGMKTGEVKGDGKEIYPVKKRTGLITNSHSVFTLFREAQCRGHHTHADITNGRASECQKYPHEFCMMICEGIKHEISTIRWRNRMCKTFDVTDSIQKLMKVHEKLERMEVPPEEDPFASLYEGMEFVDDISGAPLVKELAIAARKLEIDFFKRMGVYTKINREKWMKVITTRWIDQNKGDSETPNYRARLVGREIKRDKREDLFAATPPLESLRIIISICASNKNSNFAEDNFIIMYNDVKRAYFHAPAKRPVYIKIPDEDFEPGDEDKVGMLNLSLYGTRDAAMNWAAKYTDVLRKIGFDMGDASPCNFYHQDKNISVTVHGDDFTSTGRPKDLQWLENELLKEFEMTTGRLGPGPNHKKEVRILNRVISWREEGILYEADPRHAELIIGELELQTAKPVATPGTREDAAKSGNPRVSSNSKIILERDATNGHFKTKLEDADGFDVMDQEGYGDVLGLDTEDNFLDSQEAKVFRGLAARLNYLAQDRPDLQYAAKEVSRRMARPSTKDWALLKRVGRYLVGAPRATQTFAWQSPQSVLDAYVDSDWAGCSSTCRSTSGGAVKLGWHSIKTWSSTQATVAMSSAEAELFSLTKGAAMSLGLLSVARDLGLQLDALVHSDASAALAIAQRQGLGKLRHLKVQYLWVQERIRQGDFNVKKVLGKANPSDLLTKHLGYVDMVRHLEFLGFKTSSTRSSAAPKLHGNEYDEEADAGNWEFSEDGRVVMHHLKPRRCLFTPVRVRGAPPAKSLTSTRLTVGKFCDNGERFERRDNWTSRSTAHTELSRSWTGKTVFVSRSSSDD